MIYFVICYDRNAGLGTIDSEYTDADAHAAMRRRMELEGLHSGDESIEIVVLGSESLDSLKQTHSRYFSSIPQLAQDMRKT
jgi:hypothetical protein